ncbi:MAG TPA: isoprenylcysteine carboxylmethyltransferase family protein [Bradyrhizobium sp.]
MTIRLRASVQSLVFVVMQAATLFGSAGRTDIVEFWVYVAILAAVSALSLTLLDPDLIQERMRPGGRRVGLRFLPVIIVMFVHWTVAGLDRGRLHLSDTVPPGLEAVALALFALAWIVFVWAMYVNRFFSSIPRIQSERGHAVITTGPYRFVRHPGYTAALLAAVTSGLALGSWISTFIAPIALVGLVWRTMVEDRMLQSDLPGYADYAARVRYRLVPGIW